MFKRMFSNKSKAPKDVATLVTADLSSSLAQAQEILGKLRRGEAGSDPFPTLNEASRIVTQLANQVESMDPKDAIKEVWNEQIAEVQRELQIVTERMVSIAKTEDPTPKNPAPVFNGDATDDLFSGLTMSSPVPPTTKSSEALPTVKSGRIELDSALFSDLSGLDEAKPVQAETDTTAKLSKIPTSPPSRVKSSSTHVDAVASARSSPVRKVHSPEKESTGIGQQNPRSTTGVSVGKKKKKASHLGYGREAELSPTGRTKISARTESSGSWVEVNLPSQILDAQSSAGSGIGAFSSPRSESDGKRSIPAAPAASLIPSNLDSAGVASQNSKHKGRDIPGKINLEAVLNKAKKCNTSLSEAFAELNKKEKKLLTDRTHMLTQFAEGKGAIDAEDQSIVPNMRVADLEAKQAGAVEKEDFDNAAKLAVEIDSQITKLDGLNKDLLSMDHGVRKCGSERLAAMQKSMKMFTAVISEVNELRINCETACNESQEEKKQELAVLEADMAEKEKIMKEIEACIPQEKDGIAKSRSALKEVYQKRQEEKENSLIALRRQEDELKAEIDALKLDLEAKERLLVSVVQDIKKTKNENDEDYKVRTAQLTNREMLLSKEEQRLASMKSKADSLSKKYQQSKEASAKLQKQHEDQLSKVRFACSTFEEEIESLARDMARDKEKKEADRRKLDLEQLRKREGDELKDLGLKIIDLRAGIRGLEEEIATEDARLPQIEDLKTAAALAKDFKEAAALSAQAKEAAKKKEDAEAKLVVAQASLRDSEEQQTVKTGRVVSVKSDLVKAMKDSALALYTQLKVDLHLAHLSLADRSDGAKAAVEKVCAALAAEYEFSEEVVARVVEQIDKLV